MEAFKNAWLAIDTNGTGRITTRELVAYMRRNNYEESFVNKWLRLFDKDNSGTIEIEEYCDVLGLSHKQILGELRVKISGSGGGQLPAGVEIISSDMDISWKIKIAQLCIDGLRSTASMKDVPAWIKRRADDLYGNLWHVVIASGQFWCYYGHEPGYSLVFRYEKYFFMIWKSPVDM